MAGGTPPPPHSGAFVLVDSTGQEGVVDDGGRERERGRGRERERERGG